MSGGEGMDQNRLSTESDAACLTSEIRSRDRVMASGTIDVERISTGKRRENLGNCWASNRRKRQLWSASRWMSHNVSRYLQRVFADIIDNISARFLKMPTRTSSRSFRNISKVGSNCVSVSSVPSVFATRCSEWDRVRRTLN